MNKQWRNFLIDNGAEFVRDDVAHFGSPERERRIICAGIVMADLSHYSLLKVSGEDANSFLQTQLTNDINAIKVGQSQYSAWCSPKGRVITLTLVLKMDDYYLLLLPTELIDHVGEKLAVYVLRSAVKLEQIIDQIIFGVSGPKAENEIVDIGLECPKNEYSHQFADDVLLSKIPGLMSRYIFIAGLTKSKEIWSKLDVKSAPVGKDAWDLTEIRAGIPFIDENTTECFVPQMLNLHKIPAVDFNKGCYPGQEVVARMQYLGKAKRKMYHIEIERTDAIQNGAKLTSKSSKSSQGAGNIINSAVNGDGKIEALAVLEQEILTNDDLQDADGNSIKHMELSY